MPWHLDSGPSKAFNLEMHSVHIDSHSAEGPACETRSKRDARCSRNGWWGNIISYLIHINPKTSENIEFPSFPIHINPKNPRISNFCAFPQFQDVLAQNQFKLQICNLHKFKLRLKIQVYIYNIYIYIYNICIYIMQYDIIWSNKIKYNIILYYIM